MKKTKLLLWHKVAITLASLGVVSGVTVGSMFAFAANSDEVNGEKSQANKELFANNFAAIFNQEGNLEPALAIVDPLKKNKVANVLENGKKFSWVGQKETYTTDEFFQEYYKKYNEGFILQVRYGSFNFYNEYVLAVKPDKFIDFTKWFITDVPWGPDLLTLNSFRLVPGVQTRGNAITLGSHSTLHKEESEIKFYPDAFFGSMPFYSISAGPGNATDSLTYSTFAEQADFKTAIEYLESLPMVSALNNSGKSVVNKLKVAPYKNVYIPLRLENQKVLVSKKDVDKTRVVLPFLSQADYAVEVSKNASLAQLKLSYADFESKTIKNVYTKYNNDKEDGDLISLNLRFSDTANDEIKLEYKNTSNASKVTATYLEKMYAAKLVHFYDWYDLNNYLNIEFFVYEDNNVKRFFNTELEAQNEVRKFDKTKLKKLSTKEFSVQNKVLTVTMSNNDKYTYDAANLGFEQYRELARLQQVLGYKGSTKPIGINASPQDKTLVDENGKELDNLASRKYQIYTEVYGSLLEIIAKKYPHLLKKATGPHVVKTVNEQGFLEYSLGDGEYVDFNMFDRIGLPLLMESSIDGFDGLSTEFLKYVAAHEYGHHYTLEKTQAADQENSVVVVGGLNPRAGVGETSYYNANSLRNYLLARTNLDFDRVDVQGNKKDDGVFVNFKFKNSKTGLFESETFSDIWGSKTTKGSVKEVVSNKRRRFLQDYEGMLEAAKLRNATIGDLYIANSLDYSSGTINPSLVGQGKFVVKDEKGNKTFKTLTNKDMLDSFRDGMGNKLTYTPTGSSFRINVFEETIDPTTKLKTITKVLIKNADGTDVIKVPLNKQLSPSEAAYVEAKATQVRASILALLDTRFSNNGWNTSSSYLGGSVSLNLGYLIPDRNNNGAKELKRYEARGNQVELNPANNNIKESITGNKKVDFRNLSVEVKTSGSKLTDELSSLLLGSFLNINDPKITGDKGTHIALDQTNVHSLLTFVSKEGNNFKELESYVTADKLETIVGKRVLSNPDKRFNDLLKRFGAGLPQSNARYAKDVAYSFSLLAGLTRPTGLFPTIKLISYVDKDNKLVDLFAEGKINPLVTGLVLNPFDTRFTSLNSDLSKSLNKNNVSIKKDDKTNETKTGIKFSSLQELLKFVSLDYSKAKLENKTINWDIDYAKTKFDFTEAKKLDVYKNKQDQEIANDLFKKFASSDLFMFVKNFKASELESNKVAFSSDYGIDFLNKDFKAEFSLFPSEEGKDTFNTKDLKTALDIYATKNGFKTSEKMDFEDLLYLIGNRMRFGNLGEVPNYSALLFPQFSGSEASSDVINYNTSRVEAQLEDKFTDYIYNIAETLTRDYVQISYIPEEKDFYNLPSFLKGVSESSSGLDYIIDANQLKFWQDRKLDLAGTVLSTRAFIKAKKSADFEDENNKLIQKHQPAIDKIQIEIEKAKKDLTDKKITQEEFQKIQTELGEKHIKLIEAKFDEITAARKKAQGVLIDKKTYDEDQSRFSSYFGQFLSKSNGYFKDRWQKEMIGMELYEDNGAEKNDTSIRLKDFEGKAITSRPKAFFVSQLLNYGVGSRSVAGLFRNKEQDALSMYGFIKNDLAAKVKNIRFLNTKTGEAKYLPVNIDKTNNIFYLTKQGDAKSKVYLKDLGYSSWISDYGLMAKYRDTLLDPKSSYYVDFTDEHNMVVGTFSLGDLKQLSENGKEPSQAPIILHNEKVFDEASQKMVKTGKVILAIDYQFNITG
ncbi:PDxFFG protein [Mycoplasmopsis alligatoris]|uniref:PDxFFG protein n=1 Tax=Mycoplasmopsis alligatoris A21JP2 TaxID=747682 RepID=D4XVZ8_9BACT|nr:PDxFFG protein [Mycoplasmopsis alligatoris]EFF41465.1 conserved hypothetical protein [Mycoplasmopsis alligatoris A21JP2]